MANTLFNVVVNKIKGSGVSTSYTQTFNPNSPGTTISTPTRRDHLTDIFSTRQANDARTLIKGLMQQDPDMGATVNAYLTLANTQMVYVVKDADGQIDKDGMEVVRQLIIALTMRNDYTLKFQLKPDVNQINENMRYMILASGAVASELVLDKTFVPASIALIDPYTVEWTEAKPGEYKPKQNAPGASERIDLDIANFFFNYFRRDPTTPYASSPFVAAINTIAARQQVFNDLYRIMQVTGYPRVSLKVMEEVLIKNAPASVKENANSLVEWVNARLAEIGGQWSDLRPDQTYVHTDAVEPSVINEENPAVGMDIDSIMQALNAQNQAGLKTMATVIGRGESGVNTGSVEAVMFAKYADELNDPIAKVWSEMLTLAYRLQGNDGLVEVWFLRAEMRPDLELESQLMQKQQRLLQDLSLGLITDEEYHLEMYNRPAPAGAPTLSGTNFMQASRAADPASDGPSAATPSPGSTQRAVTPKGAKNAKSNAVKSNKKPAS